MTVQIDPNIKGCINAGIAVCGVISLLGVSVFPDYIPSPIAKDIFQTASFIFAVYGGLNSAGNFLSSNKRGALAPPDPPVVNAARALAALPENAGPGQLALARRDVKTAADEHTP